MKSREVIKLLKVTRPTLCRYVKDGDIKVTKLDNGFYDYDEKDVYKKIGVEDRYTVIYGRENSSDEALKRQLSILKEYAEKNGLKIDKVYQDMGSGLSYTREGFKKLIKDITENKISTVIIYSSKRLMRTGLDVWKDVFKAFNCELIAVNGVDIDDEGAIDDLNEEIKTVSGDIFNNNLRFKLENTRL